MWFAIYLALQAASLPQEIELIGGFCCDDNDIAQCKIWPFEPVGNPCWCPGMRPDSGRVCL